MLAALAAAALVCGPAAAPTLASTEQTRIYVHNGEARACMPGRGRSLGPASRIVSVHVAGRFTAVRRRWSGGQWLRVYDLRSGKVFSDPIRVRRFTEIRLLPSGNAVFLATLRGRDVMLGDSVSYDYHVSRVDLHYLQIAGPVMALRWHGRIWLRWIYYRRAPDGELLRNGPIRIDFVRGQLLAHLQDSRPIDLGEPQGNCDGTSNCYGVSALDFAQGRYVATLVQNVNEIFPSDLYVYDLQTRRKRHACRNVRDYIFTAARHTACEETTGSGRARIRIEGVVVDTDIDDDSLQRRGNRVYWRKNRVERSRALD